MRVQRLYTERFRNLQSAAFEPTDGINILYGDNAQGKTNLLEALWLFTGGRSFRGAKDSEMVTLGEESAALKLDFFAEERKQSAAVTLSPRRSAQLNGVSLGSASKLAGRFCGIVFSPVHLSLIKNGPEQRRQFLDAAYCQLRPGYVGTLRQYQRVLNQRNNLLRQMRRDPMPGQAELLDVFDSQLVAAGCRLIRVRAAYLSHISPLAAEVYSGLSSQTEQLALRYVASGDVAADGSMEQLREQLTAAVAAARSADVAAGFSTVGPHRDDFDVTINGLSARIYASQGQQRSAVLALKLAEAKALEEVINEPPVAFLDDVMSELDERRQEYLLKHLTAGQVFLTCCEPTAVVRFSAGARFYVQGGRITAQ